MLSDYEPLASPSDRSPTPSGKRGRVNKRLLSLGIVLLILVVALTGQHKEVQQKLRMLIPDEFTCPQPHLVRSPSSARLDRQLLLPSKASPFNVSLSYNSRLCNTFDLLITRRDPTVCSAALLINPSKDEELNRYIKTALGPDTLEIHLAGAERLARSTPAFFDVQACSYGYSFSLSNPGPLYLTITHLYADYHGFREDYLNLGGRGDFASPVVLNLAVLDGDVPLELNLCASCPSLRLSSPAALPAEHSLPLSLPQCSPFSNSGGSYIPSPLSLVHTLHPTLYHLPTILGRPLAGLYDWIPRCRWAHAGLRGWDHAFCLKEKHRVLMIGDSHLRVLMEATEWRLKGKVGMLEGTIKAEGRKVVVGELELDFRWEPYVNETFWRGCEFLDRFDSIITTVGTHAAAWYCPSTSNYLDLLTSTLDALSSCSNPRRSPSSSLSLSNSSSTNPIAPRQHPKRLQQHIFLTLPPAEQNSNRSDCRTPPRLRRWNSLARKAAGERGWAVVDFEALAIPLREDSWVVDGTHYLKTDAIEPLVDEFLGKLGICEGRDGEQSLEKG